MAWDEKKLERTARRSTAKAMAASCSTRPSASVADKIFTKSGTRLAPYSGIPTFLTAPHMPVDADEPGFRQSAGRDRRHPHGSWRHQPSGFALRTAGAAFDRAHRPLQPCARLRAGVTNCVSPTSATCRSRAATGWSLAMTISKSASTRSSMPACIPLSVGGDHSITHPILKAVGKKTPGRHDPHRRPLRHRRRLRPHQVPPWRPVPQRGARRCARSDPRRCRSASAARPNISGSSPTSPA